MLRKNKLKLQETNIPKQYLQNSNSAWRMVEEIMVVVEEEVEAQGENTLCYYSSVSSLPGKGELLERNISL